MPLEIIKVCGITSVADAVFAARNGATALGFIFFPGSPRYLRVEEAAMIAAAVPRGVLRVGVFVDEDPGQIRQAVSAARLDVVQLQGNEPPSVRRDLEGLRIWKAFRVGDGFDPASVTAFECDAYLLDTARKGSYGGTGHTFPWRIAGETKKHGPVIIAGGLDGSNVADAIRAALPYGVDACSKLESKPGVKDNEKVRQYLAAAQSMKE